MSDFKAKMHKNRLRLLAGGAYSAPPDPLAVFNGPTSKGKDGKGKRGGKGKGKERERGGRGRKGREGENDLTHTLSQISGYATGTGLLKCNVAL